MADSAKGVNAQYNAEKEVIQSKDMCVEEAIKEDLPKAEESAYAKVT